MIKICFICHGNICRSPMAEFVLKDMVRKTGASSEFEIISRATSTEEIGNDIHPGTRKVLKKHGIPTFPRMAIQLTARDYQQYDYLIAMDRITTCAISNGSWGRTSSKRSLCSFPLRDAAETSPILGIPAISMRPTGMWWKAVRDC